jgi:hypothetical protein
MRCWSFIPHWRSHSLFPFMSWRWLLEDHPIVRQVRHSKLLKHHTFRSIWRFEWEHHQTKWGVQNFANQTVFDYGKVNPVSIHEYLIIIPSSHHPISQSFSASGLQNPWILPTSGGCRSTPRPRWSRFTRTWVLSEKRAGASSFIIPRCWCSKI